MVEFYKSYTSKVIKLFQALDYHEIDQAKNLLVKTRNNKNIIYIFGNGGSGASASHIAGDYVKGASYNQREKFKFMCLNDNYAALSAISNDIDYKDIFALQLDNFVSKGDLVIGLSGSGNSENVIRALQLGNERGATTLAFSAYKGGEIKDIASAHVYVPISDMEIAEDLHMMIFHMIKQAIITEQKGSLSEMGDRYKRRIKD
ncbi:MAG: SIS domain-containing protein [Ekhidna sp.]|nr:SIS domain-containing protein [Ekhidna sp.]